MRHIAAVFHVLAGLVLSTACSSGTTVDAADSQLLRQCSGRYRCLTADGTPFAVALDRSSDGVCMLGGRELRVDGTTHVLIAPDREETWTGDARRIQICESGKGCVVCRNPDAPAEPDDGTKQCTGSPSSCATKSPGSCAEIDGCSMDSHLRYDGSWDNECVGSPRACSTKTNEKSCLEQGCRWE